MTMPNLCDDKKTCCGCAACAAVCPVSAIGMRSDGAFDYPAVDEATCVNCGKCERVCPFKREKKTAPVPLAAFAVKHTDGVRLMSSSGGIFTALSDAVLENGGAVYGAAYDEAMRVTHQRADAPAARDPVTTISPEPRNAPLLNVKADPSAWQNSTLAPSASVSVAPK